MGFVWIELLIQRFYFLIPAIILIDVMADHVILHCFTTIFYECCVSALTRAEAPPALDALTLPTPLSNWTVDARLRPLAYTRIIVGPDTSELRKRMQMLSARLRPLTYRAASVDNNPWSPETTTSPAERGAPSDTLGAAMLH